MTHAALKDLADELEALNFKQVDVGGIAVAVERSTISRFANRIRAALTAMEGEAVVWVDPADVRERRHGLMGTADETQQQGTRYTMALYTAPPPQQAGMSAMNHELERFKVQVEKRLCAILGKHWQPAGGGICIDNLCEEIAARIATHPTPSPGPQGGGEVDYTDIANRVQAVTGRSIWPSTVKAILDIATPPAHQPGEVGLPDGAAYILRDQLSRKFAVMLSEKSCAGLLTAALAPKEAGHG